MAFDWGAVGGTVGGIVGVALVVSQALQKNRIDALATAQENLKLKNDQIEMLVKRVTEAEEKAKSLEIENGILNKLFKWDTVPSPMQSILDKVIAMQERIEDMQEKIVEMLDRVSRLVFSETGKMDDERH